MNLRLPALLAILLVACSGESPTAPSLESAQRVAAEGKNVHGISASPDPIVVEVGETKTVAISTTWTFVLPIGFNSRNTAIAAVSGNLPPYAATTTLTVTGVSVGDTELWDYAPNIARPPGSAFLTKIHVRPPRRRAVRS